MDFGQNRVRLLLGLCLLNGIHLFINIIHRTQFIFRVIFISFIDVVIIFISVSIISCVVPIVPSSTIVIISYLVVVVFVVASSLLVTLTFITN